MDENNKRLAKNSVIMYVQVLLNMVIGFISSRVLLKTLGASDFGTYNVVAGFVGTMAIISGPMVSGVQRFFAYDIGKGNNEQLTSDFNTTNFIYIFFGVIIVALLETVGLWFLDNHMSFENGRTEVVHWVYQLAVFSFFFFVISTPYNALILAHENIFINTVFEIINRVGNLVIIIALSFIPYDYLVTYSTLTFLLSVLMRIAPRIYCKIKYPESRFYFFWDKQYFKSIVTYSGFNTIGVLAVVGRTQGVNILLNMFFGPVVNAANAISAQLQGIVSSLYTNIFTPTRPQITKYYAREEFQEMWLLVVRASKVMFFVCMMVSVPLGLEAEYVLKIWLGDYPELAPSFLRLSLVVSLFSSSSVLNCAVLQSANKIKREQVFVATITLMTLPISFVALKLGAGPIIPFLVAVLLQFISIIVDIQVVQYELKTKMSFYYMLLLKMYGTCALSLVLPYSVMSMMPSSFLRILLVALISIVSCSVLTYLIILDKNDRDIVAALIWKVKGKRRNG